MLKSRGVPEMKKPWGQLLSCGPWLHFSCQLFIWEKTPKTRSEIMTAGMTLVQLMVTLFLFFTFTSVSLTVECVHIQQHCALPLVGGPLQLGGGVDSGSGSWELQRCQQFVLAQWAVLPWTVIGHIPAREIPWTESRTFDYKCLQIRHGATLAFTGFIFVATHQNEIFTLLQTLLWSLPTLERSTCFWANYTTEVAAGRYCTVGLSSFFAKTKLQDNELKDNELFTERCETAECGAVARSGPFHITPTPFCSYKNIYKCSFRVSEQACGQMWQSG